MRTARALTIGGLGFASWLTHILVGCGCGGASVMLAPRLTLEGISACDMVLFRACSCRVVGECRGKLAAATALCGFNGPSDLADEFL